MGTSETACRSTAENLQLLTGHDAPAAVLSMLETASPHGYRHLLAEVRTTPAGMVTQWLVVGYADPAVVRVSLVLDADPVGPRRPVGSVHTGAAEKRAAWTFTFDDARGEIDVSLPRLRATTDADETEAEVRTVLAAALGAGASGDVG